MSARSFAAIQKAFAPEAEELFSFLVRDFDFIGPEYSDLVIQEIAYFKPGLCFRISLDYSEMSVLTQIETDTGAARLVADLGKVVSAAGIQDGNRVRGNVHSLKNLRKVLEEYARLARILQPYLTLDSTVDLMRKAGAREWRAS